MKKDVLFVRACSEDRRPYIAESYVSVTLTRENKNSWTSRGVVQTNPGICGNHKLAEDSPNCPMSLRVRETAKVENSYNSVAKCCKLIMIYLPLKSLLVLKRNIFLHYVLCLSSVSLLPVKYA